VVTRGRRGKRALDLAGAGIGILVVSPLLAAIALSVWLNDRGPVLFRQRRIGQGGRPFEMLKFRTMTVNAERQGPQITIGDDPRITRVGRVLRRYKLDELPQLWNVLRRDMSLVGPRPEVERYVRLYTDEQRRVLELMPGITDPASIRFRNEAEILDRAADPQREYVERVMPEKIRINLEYARGASVWTDFLQVLRTVLGRRR
jgi:lipopolysaccharide/colanic/teichoic acid biosynthesis glycosyltransferase